MNSKHEYRFEVASLDDSIPCRVLYFSKPGINCYTSSHVHTSIEIDYIVSGCMNIENNKKTIEVSDNEYTVINSHDIHSTICPDADRYVTYLVLIFSEKYMRAYFHNYENFYFDVDNNPAVKEEIRSCLNDIVHYIEMRRSFLDLGVNVLTAHILDLLFVNCAVPRKNGASSKRLSIDETAAKAEKYIEEHFREKISLDDVAQHVGFASQYFSQYFKNNMGQTFYEHLNYTRLRHTLIDIQSGDVSETKAALDNGFPSVKAFISIFKKRFGCTLSEYKKLKGIVPLIPSDPQFVFNHYVDE